MKCDYRIVLYAILIIAAQSCNRNSEQHSFAETEYYLLDLVDSVNTTYTQSVLKGIEVYLSAPERYFLSEKSASQGWPFYGTTTLTQDVNIDSLLIPHHKLHQLIKWNGEDMGKVLRLKIVKVDSSYLWFKESILKLSIEGEEIMAMPPVDRVKISGKTEPEIVTTIAKSVIRASFK